MDARSTPAPKTPAELATFVRLPGLARVLHAFAPL